MKSLKFLLRHHALAAEVALVAGVVLMPELLALERALNVRILETLVPETTPKVLILEKLEYFPFSFKTL